jgi:ATP-dependent Lhr-like helicase
MEYKLEKAKLRSKEELENSLHPLVKEWFKLRFPDFSLTQLYGVMPIHERKNILISAPTGGTKTLTAFLAVINYLVTLSVKKELEDKVYAVYVSPLKALSNDIHVNLERPLKEIQDLAKDKNIEMQEIRTGLRTGDTETKERAKMLRKPPHIYVTTPESLAISITSPKFCENLKAVEFIVIDEIHAMANKRGVHLSLVIERLQDISKIWPVRIGLSATIAPLEEIARFLIGSNKDCLIADVQFAKKIDIEVISPSDLIESSAFEMQKGIYEELDRLIQEHKTTIIFTNTRSATERVIHHLKDMFPGRYAEGIGAHHSSLSKELRYNIEQRLREGKLKVVVSSTSLELGIDVGYVDLVILLGSPKSTSRALQRIGRAGHKLHDIAKGRFLVTDRDDLVECAVMMKEMKERRIDRVQIPKNCLDVISQFIFGMAIEKVWKSQELYDLIRKSYCYQTLGKEEYYNVLSYLSGEYALEHRNVYAKIWYDEKTGEIGKRGKLARVIYMTNIGTIPDEAFISVMIMGTNQKVGAIDEGFLERLKRRDVFVLGGQRYEYQFTRGMKAYVKGSVNRPPTIPSWFSEMLPLSFDLAVEIGRFRSLIKENLKKGKKATIDWIKEYAYCSEDIAEKIYEYCKQQEDYIGIPTNREIIVENYKGKENSGKIKEYWVFHSLFGRRVNDALSRAIGYLIGKAGGRDVELGINDNGFYISGENIEIEKALKFLNEKNVEEILKEAIENTEVLKRRFRHCATRSLMILRNYKGREKTAGRQQVHSGFLLAAIRKLTKNFPILQEARREVLEDLMDLSNTKLVIKAIKEGAIKIKKVETSVPSPFSLGLIMQGYSDLIKIEDKMNFLRRMHSKINEEIENKKT